MDSAKTHAHLYSGLLCIMLLGGGCTTADYKTAILYKQKKDTSTYVRPTGTKESVVYNGNVIEVPRGQLAQFDLSDFKIGWLKQVGSDLSPTRLLPEKSLWLVIQVEGFKTDDFLRTSSKRSFLASAVKQNQNSLGYLALDSSETTFALQTSDFQYEVTFTLYSVDNFKLKEVIGYAVKDNPGLIKIGTDAVTQLGGSIANFVVNPFFRTAKHEFGEDFLFERVLLTAGAVSEFQGMVYIVGSKNLTVPVQKAKDGNAALDVGTFVLADLSDTPQGKEPVDHNINALQEELGKSGKTTHLDKSDITRDPRFQKSYESTFNAINQPVAQSQLEVNSANYLKFSVTANVDKNKETIGLTDTIAPVVQKEQQAREKLAKDITEERTKLYSTPYAKLVAFKNKIDDIAARVNTDSYPEKTEAVAAFMIYEGTAAPGVRNAAVDALNIAPDTKDADLLNKGASYLRPLGIEYVKKTEQFKLGGTTADPVVALGTTAKVPLKPRDVAAKFGILSDAAGNLEKKIEDKKNTLSTFNVISNEAEFDEKLASLKASTFNADFENISNPLLPDDRGVLYNVIKGLYDELSDEAVKKIKADLGGLWVATTELEKAKKAEPSSVAGNKITIF